MQNTNRWKEMKFFLLLQLARPIYYFLALYTKTLRFQVENDGALMKRLQGKEAVLLTTWHQRLFGGFFLPRMYKITVPIMVSRSKDGEFISRVVKYSGFLPVRGSSSRGGREALREMVDAIKKQGLGAHVLDGPTGPPRVVKAGLIAMAQRTGAAICPVYLVCEKCWIFNSWDRFMVPKPFSRVLLHFSKEMETVPAHLDGMDFESVRKKIEDQIIRTYEEMDRYFTHCR